MAINDQIPAICHVKGTGFDQHEACCKYTGLGPVFDPANEIGERWMDLLDHWNATALVVMSDEYVDAIALKGAEQAVGHGRSHASVAGLRGEG